MSRVVLDASVAVKWFIAEDEATTAVADRVLDEIVNGHLRPVVPELFFYEVMAVLVRRGGDFAIAASSIERLFHLGFERLALDLETALLAEELARKHGLTAYDATYAATASLLGVQWWTFDEAALRRISRLGIARLPR